jgi:patatin-related protein
MQTEEQSLLEGAQRGGPSGASEISNEYAATHEIRFAVVLYGGSSLAIYINGVVQELFHMVRATAPEVNSAIRSPKFLHASSRKPLHEKHPKGTERVYRKIGQILGSGKESIGIDYKTEPIHTRFIVDILSGTSAGGINGVFLAKALANDQKMDAIQQLWLEDGAIQGLINDKQTAQQYGLKAPNPPASLLNSQRMFRCIYEALGKMENEHRSVPDACSPYQDELDLYVTNTDIFGLKVPISLSNGVVYDLRFRNVLHFQYDRWGKRRANAGTSAPLPLNDLRCDNDRFLAYAARCTSAFPFAFEPMSLNDIYDIADYGSEEEFKADLDRWKSFFDDYLDPARAQSMREQVCQFAGRPFTDGGVLNNKPFSYATDTLRRRWSDLSVERKLVYVEPAPQRLNSDGHASNAQGRSDKRELFPKPDALSMITEALIDLPGYQAIYEDLQRVLDRNDVVAKVNDLIRGVEADMEALFKQLPDNGDGVEVTGHGRNNQTDVLKRRFSSPAKQSSFADLLQQKGSLYGAYHRLKMEAVTDALANMVVCQLGFQQNSRQADLLRASVLRWRQAHYQSESLPPDASEVPTAGQSGQANRSERQPETDFLLHFDLDYRLRKLLFLRGKINDLLNNPTPDVNQTPLLKMKADLSDVFLDLRHLDQELNSQVETPGQSNTSLIDSINALVLRGTADGSNAQSNMSLNAPGDVDRAVAEIISNIQTRISATTNQAFEAFKSVLLAAPAKVRRYYTYYDLYDAVIFPALYGTGVGETTHVDIVRISPLDATTLIDENNLSEPRRKLAGTSLGNFGALLQRPWRTNDILWGRLDGTECLIRALTRNILLRDQQDALILEAQKAIVTEMIPQQDRQDIQEWLLKVLPELPPQDRTPQKLDEFVRTKIDQKELPSLTALFGSVLSGCLNDSTMVEYLHSGYEVDRAMPHQDALQVASRMAAVLGNVMEGVAKKRSITNPAAAIPARIGQIFAGLVYVSLPNSIWHRVRRYWTWLLYLFEGLLIVGGILLGAPSVQSFGWNALLVTVFMDVLTTSLCAYMDTMNTWKRFRVRIKIFLGFVIILLSGIGGWTVFQWTRGLYPPTRVSKPGGHR